MQIFKYGEDSGKLRAVRSKRFSNWALVSCLSPILLSYVQQTTIVWASLYLLGIVGFLLPSGWSPPRRCLYILLSLLGWWPWRLWPDILLAFCGWWPSRLCDYMLLGLCKRLPVHLCLCPVWNLCGWLPSRLCPYILWLCIFPKNTAACGHLFFNSVP